MPLKAILQEKKGKVRQCSTFVNSMNLFNAVERMLTYEMKSWEPGEKNWLSVLTLLDIRDTYMQIFVDDECCKYQTVKLKDQFYTLHRLGFGLNCVHEIVKAVVSKVSVLSLDESVCKETDHYNNDIIVDLNEVSIKKLKNILLKYGLVMKPCKNLSLANVLGLKTYKRKGLVWWEWTELKSEIGPPALDSMTKLQVFSFCKKSVGHYPVVSCSVGNTRVRVRTRVGLEATF